MSAREDIDVNQSGELTATTLLSALQRLEQQIHYIGRRVDEFVPRRPIPSSVKERHIIIVSQLGGRCPCCGVESVLDESGAIINGEFDHFFSRERNAFEETWLICRSCHLQMKDRIRFTDQFRVYQQRAAAIEGGQLTLI